MLRRWFLTSFHQRTLELFGQPGGSIDPDRGDCIRRVAATVGLHLPAAVVDWHSCVPEASDLWNWYKGCDHAAIGYYPGGRQPWMEDAERAGDCFFVADPVRQGRWGMPGTREDVRGLFRVPILPVLYETQGCFWWGVPLDGTDNPPVVVSFGDQGDQWDYFASSFSDFVLARVFDRCLFYRCPAKRTIHVDEDVNADQLRALRQLFRPEVTTRQVGCEQLVQRFSGTEQWYCLTVAERDTRYRGNSEWQLWASGDEPFQSLVQTLRSVCPRLDGVRPGSQPLYLRHTYTAAEDERHRQEFPF